MLHAVQGGKGSPAAVSDDALCAALERGDRKIASQLYDRLIGPVDRAIVRVLGRRERDHDDLVQHSFEQIVKSLAARRFARACSLSTWASTIASHVALNALRARQRERRVISSGEELDLDREAPAPVDAERRLGARADVERIRQELADMSVERAEAVWLHDILGHELAEIASILGISVAAAQSRLVRGRGELLHRLRGTPGGELP